MLIRLASKLQKDSIVDGEGIRAVIWTQGCSHNCKQCQNPQTWDFNGGASVPIDMVLEAIDELEYQDGITFSGGDPMFQPEACNEIAKLTPFKSLVNFSMPGSSIPKPSRGWPTSSRLYPSMTELTGA